METTDFAADLEVLRIEAATAATAVMCAEAHPARCHRSLLADALLVQGVDVRHILAPAREAAHTLTPDARVVDGRLSYPGEPDLFGAG